MQSLIASRLTQQDSTEVRRDASTLLESAVSSLSRLSGYVAMGATLAVIAFLIF